MSIKKQYLELYVLLEKVLTRSISFSKAPDELDEIDSGLYQKLMKQVIKEDPYENKNGK